jgi:hypothetical protein
MAFSFLGDKIIDIRFLQFLKRLQGGGLPRSGRIPLLHLAFKLAIFCQKAKIPDIRKSATSTVSLLRPVRGKQRNLYVACPG